MPRPILCMLVLARVRRGSGAPGPEPACHWAETPPTPTCRSPSSPQSACHAPRFCTHRQAQDLAEPLTRTQPHPAAPAAAPLWDFQRAQPVAMIRVSGATNAVHWREDNTLIVAGDGGLYSFTLDP